MSMPMTLSTAPQTQTPTARGRLIVDAPMRMFHWLFALAFTVAYLTAEGEAWRALHVTSGYTVLGLLGFRVLYSLFGPPQARLGLMVRKLTALPQWLRSTMRQPQVSAWRQGQHLAMALAVLTLLALMLPLTVSGIATFHEWGEALWGDAMGEVHELLGDAVLMAVLAHVALIVVLSLLRRQNAAAPMLTGRAPTPGPDLVKNNRGWLAALLLCAVVGWVVWDWHQSPNGLINTAQITAGEHERDREDDD